jgi:signal transduction histidine kinase
MRNSLCRQITRILPILILLTSLIGLPAAYGQKTIIFRDSFISELITPALLRDPDRRLTIDSILSEPYQLKFEVAPGPHLSFGYDNARWWMHFTVENRKGKPQTCILRLNRKSFDDFVLYERSEDGRVKKLGGVVNTEDNERYTLVNGYYFPILLAPGKNEIWGELTNDAGTMYLGFSLHSQENFGLFSRQVSTLFGIFLGFMLVSIFFSLFLYGFSRDRFYLFYIAYVISILLREAYFNSADFDLLPILQRHCSTLLIAATYAAVYRRFLQIEEVNPRYDTFLKRYAQGAFLTALLVWALATFHQSIVLKYVFLASNIANLLFIALGIAYCRRHYRHNERAKIIGLASLPLAAAFSIISLRNLELIPNFPLIQFLVTFGFILEVMLFTAAINYWFRSVETEREVLRLKITVEQGEKQIAIQAAEQRVKDRIGRDLHDDVAASLSSIRILSQVAKTRFEHLSPDAGQLLQQINRSAQSTLDEIGDILWAIKPHPDYLNDIADRMREYATKMLEARDLAYRIDIPRNLPALELDVEARRNVYLIFKEAINNILKHSQCTQIDIGLSVDPDRLVLRVEDNGVGFDSETVLRGHGFGNMKSRATDIGGNLSVEAVAGVGTKVLFELPL